MFKSLSEEATKALRRATSTEVSEEAFWLYGNKDPRHGTEVNQCCSGAQWVPIEVLEDGYFHRIGL